MLIRITAYTLNDIENIFKFVKDHAKAEVVERLSNSWSLVVNGSFGLSDLTNDIQKNLKLEQPVRLARISL